MRLSLLSDDNDVAELLINKAMELMSQAETAAAGDDAAAIGKRDREPDLPTTPNVPGPDEGA